MFYKSCNLSPSKVLKQFGFLFQLQTATYTLIAAKIKTKLLRKYWLIFGKINIDHSQIN